MPFAENYEKIITETSADSNHFMALWMSATASVMSILKFQGTIDKFVARAHGNDVDIYRNKDNFLPMFQFNLVSVEKVFTNSDYTRKLILNQYSNETKIITQYISLKDYFKI